MHKKTKNPFLFESFDWFNKLNVSPHARIVLFSIVSRNGLTAGQCDNEIIANRSGYSRRTVSRACQELQKKKLYYFWFCRDTKKRFGGLILSNNIYNEYSNLFHIKSELFSAEQDYYSGVISYYDPKNQFVVLKSKDKTHNNYKIIFDSKEELFTTLPIGHYVRFQASIIKIDTEITILIKPFIKFVKSNFGKVSQ